jgi:hypothetical protein
MAQKQKENPLVLEPQAERVAELMGRLNSSKGVTQEEMRQQGIRLSAMDKKEREQSSTRSQWLNDLR